VNERSESSTDGWNPIAGYRFEFEVGRPKCART